MRDIGRVAGLWIYPVKSMCGQSVADAFFAGCGRAAVRLEPRGLDGDRLYAVYDAARKIGSGKNTRRFARMDGLARWRARLGEAGVEVAAPGGAWRPADETADALMSAGIGRPVHLAREAEIAHFDIAPLHVLTSGDLAQLEQLAGAAPPAETFRPNLLIDCPLLSRDLLGAKLRIGEASVTITAPTERCLMVNLTPQGERGPDFLRPIAQRLDACFGVYAEVEAPGLLALGDSVFQVSDIR